MNSPPPQNGATGKKPKRSKPPSQKHPNPIEAALIAWWATLPLPLRERHAQDRDQLVAQAPKRWTAYEPMALLPTGAFGSTAWRAILEGGEEEGEEGEEHVNRLWRGILSEISKKQKAPPLTHLAINEGIPLHHHHHHSDPNAGGAQEANNKGNSNILRSPSGLRMLYGDFGPSTILSSDGGGGGDGSGPSAADFAAAFWVSTRQNGIFQTWAPRWTMFSRGNVKEKARLLDFHNSSSQPSSLEHRTREVPAARLRQRACAVDLYAGIGYFVFSYARLGMRVLCWELNPWSVEGLRRGAKGNGWSVRVVQGEELLSAASSSFSTSTSTSMDEILKGGEQIVVFLEDNANAAGRVAALQRGGGGDGGETRPSLDVLHVNCGLLPASDASWKGAWDIVGQTEQPSWLHLHENVGVADIERRKGEIERWFRELAERDGGHKAVYVDHVEQVKTFAPGVWHCVFDLYIKRSNRIT